MRKQIIFLALSIFVLHISAQTNQKLVWLHVMKDGVTVDRFRFGHDFDRIEFHNLISHGQFTDTRDGNTYKTVRIGSQWWMAENLKATKYNDGTDIPHVTDAAEWSDLSTPAYCFYDNDVVNKDTYGALYNWYAVQTGKLCPEGWHVPSDNEWAELENYLADNGFNYDGSINGGRGRIAKAMASENGWGSSIEQGTVGNTDYPEYRNKSGYSALPGGLRSDEGAFHYIGYYGFWWSSTEFSANYIYIRSLSYNGANVLWTEYGKRRGFSVRCVRD